MLVVHLTAALLAGLVAALLGIATGQGLWVSLLLYVLGGNLGLLASVSATLLAKAALRRASLPHPQEGEVLPAVLVRSDV